MSYVCRRRSKLFCSLSSYASHAGHGTAVIGCSPSAVFLSFHPELSMHIESLEPRIAPAATSSFAGGVLTITGDDGDNAITIGETGTPGGYNVLGLDAGQESAFTNVTAIVVKLLGGTDSLIFNGSSGAGTALKKDLKISSAGALTATINANTNITGLLEVTHSGTGLLDLDLVGVGITAGGLTVKDGEGSATIDVDFRTHIAKNFLFTDGPGAGNGVVHLLGTVGGSATHKSSSSGSDLFVIHAALIGGGVNFTSSASNSGFALENGTMVKGSVKLISTGTGSNTVTLEGTTFVFGNLSVTAGAANDTVNIRAFVAGNTALKLGEGSNALNVPSGAHFGGNVAVTIGTGIAELNLDGCTIGGALTINAKKSLVAADVDITSSKIGKLSLTTGAGNDTFDTSDLTVFGTLTAQLGAGNNTTTMSDVTASAFAFGGGTGNDIVSITGFSTPGAISFAASTGNNSLALLGGGAKSVKHSSSAGFDTLTLRTVEIRGATSLNVGGGGSEVTVSDAQFGAAFSLVASDGTNELSIETLTDNAISTFFGGAFLFKAGAGNDSVSLGLDTTDLAYFVGSVKFDGGGGANAITDSNVVFLFPPVFVNFN